MTATVQVTISVLITHCSIPDNNYIKYSIKRICELGLRFLVCCLKYDLLLDLRIILSRAKQGYGFYPAAAQKYCEAFGLCDVAPFYKNFLPGLSCHSGSCSRQFA